MTIMDQETATRLIRAIEALTDQLNDARQTLCVGTGAGADAASVRFVVPSLLDVQRWIDVKSYHIDAAEFLSFYDSKGWKIGKNKMDSWKGALRTWHLRDEKSKQKTYSRI